MPGDLRIHDFVCIHCGKRKRYRRRLCWTCYGLLSVRWLYLPYARGWPTLAPSYGPTNAMAGSPAKIRVMAERAEAGMPIFCPGDNEEIDPEARRSARNRDYEPIETSNGGDEA